MHSFLVSYARDMPRPARQAPISRPCALAAPCLGRPQLRRASGNSRASQKTVVTPVVLRVSPLLCVAPLAQRRWPVEPANAREYTQCRKTACSQAHRESRTFKGVTQPLWRVKNHFSLSGPAHLPSGLTSSRPACTQSLLCSTSPCANKGSRRPEWFDHAFACGYGGQARRRLPIRVSDSRLPAPSRRGPDA